MVMVMGLCSWSVRWASLRYRKGGAVRRSAQHRCRLRMETTAEGGMLAGNSMGRASNGASLAGSTVSTRNTKQWTDGGHVAPHLASLQAICFHSMPYPFSCFATATFNLLLSLIFTPRFVPTPTSQHLPTLTWHHRKTILNRKMKSRPC